MSKILNAIKKIRKQSATAQVPLKTVQEAIETRESVDLTKNSALKPPLPTQTCKPVANNINTLYGNKLQLVNKEIYLPILYKSLYTDIKPEIPLNYPDEIDDNLRFAAQKYWYNLKGGALKYIRPENLEATQSVPFEIRIGEPVSTDAGASMTMDQIIHLLPKEDRFLDANGKFDDKLWGKYVNGGSYAGKTFSPLVELARPFNDFSFDQFLPIEDELSVLAKKATISVNYNFHIKNFELVATARPLPEQIMPNVYAMVANIENSAGNDNVSSLNKLDNLLEDILVAQRNGSAMTFRDNAQYFDEWARQANNVSDSWTQSIKRKFSDIIFESEELERGLMDIAQQRENIYPFSIQVDFTTDTTTEFAQILSDSKLSKNFTRSLVTDLIAEREGFDTNILDQEFAVANYSSAAVVKNSKVLRTWDITSWWYALERESQNTDIIPPIKVNEEFKGFLEEKNSLNNLEERVRTKPPTAVRPAITPDIYGAKDFGTFLDAFPDLQQEAENSSFYSQILRIILAGKLSKFFKKHMRDYCSILSGKPAYSEPVLYRISKHAVLPSGFMIEKPVQNFYFPNTNNIDVLSFVDTQVKYKKKYVYKIWSYHAIVGNQYIYEPVLPNTTNTKTAKNIVAINSATHIASVKVKNTSLLLLAEVEQKQFDPIQLLDDPPLPPLVDFIPYLGDDRKIGVSLCNSAGEYRATPIPLEPDDLDEFAAMLKRQKSEDGMLRFASDDSPSSFDIFRIQVHPESYADFTDAKLASLSTAMPENPIQHSDEATYMDTLRPNTKYYYVFRTVDYHGHTSNPSAVYRVELVNNSGAIYPLIDVVDFIKREEKFPTKTFRKFLRINVNQMQKAINLEKSRIFEIDPKGKVPDNIVLGLADESVWQRQFKVRVTSRTSGKKIDINFKFDKETKQFKASTAGLEDILVENPGSVADIINTLANNK